MDVEMEVKHFHVKAYKDESITIQFVSADRRTMDVILPREVALMFEVEFVDTLTTIKK